MVMVSALPPPPNLYTASDQLNILFRPEKMISSIIMRRLVWLTVLSCLLPPILGECETGKSAATGTCGIGAAIAGAASIFACVGTLGLGCGLIAGAGALAASCAAIADSVECNDLEPG